MMVIVARIAVTPVFGVASSVSSPRRAVDSRLARPARPVRPPVCTAARRETSLSDLRQDRFAKKCWNAGLRVALHSNPG